MLLVFLLACSTMELRYTCDTELVREVPDPDAPVAELDDASVNDVVASLARSEPVVFDASVGSDAQIEAPLHATFTPDGSARVMRALGGDGPGCDTGATWLEVDGTLDLAIDGFATTRGPATVKATVDAVGVTRPAALDAAFEGVFLAEHGACDRVDATLSLGADVAGLAYTADCDEGTTGGPLLEAVLPPAP